MSNWILKYISPHIQIRSLNNLNFEYLKNSLNIKYLIFDKDDTLTNHHLETIHPSINTNTIQSICKHFPNRSFIVSNSRRVWQMEYGLMMNTVLSTNSFKPILTDKKKPFNFKDILNIIQENETREIKSTEICVIGDRVFTDALLARFNNCLSICTKAFDDSKRTPGIEFMRKIESRFILNSFDTDNILVNSFNGQNINLNNLVL